MKHVLRHPQDPGRQLANAVAAMIDRSATALEDGVAERQPVPAAVHESRRILKRARALLRLAGRGKKRSDTRTLARSLRDVGRQLSVVRDQDARLEAVDRLLRDQDRRSRDQDRLLRDHDDPVDALLELRHRLAASPRPASRATIMAAAAVDLRAAHELATRLRIDDRGFATFATGLRKIHKRGRKAVARLDGAKDEAHAHHRLRKRAKNLRHALEFLEVLWPPVLQAWHSELHRLTDQLGEANDYSLVLEGLGPGSADEATSILREARQRRWDQARPLAERIWSSSDQRFVDSVESLWAAWLSEQPRPDAADTPAHELSAARHR